MKKTINGSRYDTDKATLVAERFGEGGLRAYAEALWRTPRGRFFLTGVGGGLTRWARRGGGLSSGMGLLPLTDGEAAEWLDRA